MGLRYLALGDSITADRPGIVTYCNNLDRESKGSVGGDVVPLSVVNQASPGNTTRRLLDEWASQVGAIQPEIVSIMLGANDHYVDVGMTVPRVSLSDYAANMAEIIDRLRRIQGSAFNGGVPYVLCFAPPFVSNDLGSDWRRLRDYAEAVRAVCKSKVTGFVDLNTITAGIVDWNQDEWRAKYTGAHDGMHLNSLAHTIITPHVKAALLQAAYGLRLP